jgi:hypothetical protein
MRMFELDVFLLIFIVFIFISFFMFSSSLCSLHLITCFFWLVLHNQYYLKDYGLDYEIAWGRIPLEQLDSSVPVHKRFISLFSNVPMNSSYCSYLHQLP